MKNLFFILLVISISSCLSYQKTEDINEYAEADKLITDIIFNTPEYHLELSPIERSLSFPDVERTQAFDAYGYRINLPWQLECETIRNEYVSGIYAPGKVVLMFDNPDNSTNSDMFMNMLDDLEEISAYRNDYKDYIKSKSNYELVTAALNFTADSISPDDSLYKKIIAMTLLGIKGMYLIESDKIDVISDPIYHFQTDTIKGYQVGDTIRGRCVRIALFPDANEELNILIMIAEGFKVTQSEIDFVIQNVQKTQ